ncbi:MAG TPA: malto-oligosyltrehalose trehalohydrolase [Polyangiaceae bacterium]|jgi:maltooligosyltrehalose trehalohydrolase
MRLGAELDDSGVTFALFTTTASRCSVELATADGAPLGDLPMKREVGGFFVARRDGLGAGTLYRFVLDGKPLPDPYARALPEGVHGRARVVDLRYPFAHACVSRPLAEHVIYELHVGTFTPGGTFASAKARLPYLADLGVTMIELMPVAAFAGERGWGYDGVALFAPHAAYGTPRDLQELVDEAHRLGLATCLDVVYNHLGPDGNYLASYSPEYFAKSESPWGQSFDWSHPIARELVLSNAMQWLASYRFDALRLDAIHHIDDRSERPILAELAQRVATLSPKRLLIAEDERNDPTCIESWGLDAMWADDFHHQVRVTLTGEREGYYAAFTPGVADVAKAIDRGWLYEGQYYAPTKKHRGRPATTLARERLVYCLENHDQVGNRPAGDRLSRAVSLDTYCAVSLLLLLLPATPLIFMGQEWCATTPFAYFTDHAPELGRAVTEGRRHEFADFPGFSDPSRVPDPQAIETFRASKLDWNEPWEGDHRRVHELYRAALAARRSDPLLRATSRDALRARADGELLVVIHRAGEDVRGVVVNFGDAPRSPREIPELDGARAVLWSSEAHPGQMLPPHTTVLFSGRSR